MTADLRIETITAEHAGLVRDVFAEGIATGNATFEVEPPAWAAWDAGHHPVLRLAAVDADGTGLGWASTTQVSARQTYSGVVELGLYVASAARGRGVGTTLLGALLDLAPDAGVWTVQSTVFPENAGSLAVHRRHGFREIGRRERIGLMRVGPYAGRWRDTLLLEKRL